MTRFGMPNSRGSHGRVAILLLAAAALFALVIPATAGAKKKKSEKVTVMSRNAYLGADLAPGLDATGIDSFIDAAGGIVNQVDRTNFPVRAKALAKEIKDNDPDLVGLQEVALWRTAPAPDLIPGATNHPVATDVEYDFLALLLNELNGGSKGPKYKAVVEKPEFDFETPVNDTGPSGGLAQADRNARLTMRDVILAKKGDGVKTSNPTSGTFDTLLRVTIAGAVPVDVTRGWTAVDAKVRGTKFNFVNTHFEAFDSAASNHTNKGTDLTKGNIRAAQGTELVGAGGPASPKNTILVGDLNSDDDTVADDGDRNAYRAVTAGGFKERSTDHPLGCCLSDPNLAGGSLADFDHQVDHVLTNNKKIKFDKGVVTGRKIVNGLWPSDHNGLVSILKVPK